MLSTDRLDLLQLFVRVAEAGKISEAADAVGISQPSASRLLKRLESILSTQLFLRTAKGVKLTAGGEEALVSARDLLRQWDQVAHSQKMRPRTLSGHIRVAASIPVGQTIVASLVARFAKQHPGLTVDLDLRYDQIDLNATNYDLWIRAGQVKSGQLIVKEISRVDRAIFCSPTLGALAHPSQLRSLQAIRLIPYISESIRLGNKQSEVFVLRQSCVMTTNNLHAARAAVVEGIGYAVLPLWIVRQDIEDGKLLQTCPEWLPESVTLSLAFLPSRNRPARITALSKYLLQELSDSKLASYATGSSK